jgi:aconitate hydratase
LKFFRAINEENNEANNVKNRLTNEWGKVPDTARYYKVNKIKQININFYILIKE